MEDRLGEIKLGRMEEENGRDCSEEDGVLHMLKYIELKLGQGDIRREE